MLTEFPATLRKSQCWRCDVSVPSLPEINLIDADCLSELPDLDTDGQAYKQIALLAAAGRLRVLKPVRDEAINSDNALANHPILASVPIIPFAPAARKEWRRVARGLKNLTPSRYDEFTYLMNVAAARLECYGIITSPHMFKSYEEIAPFAPCFCISYDKI